MILMRQQACRYYEQTYKEDARKEATDDTDSTEETQDSGKVYYLSDEDDTPEFWGWYRARLDQFAEFGLLSRLTVYWKRQTLASESESDEDKSTDSDSEEEDGTDPDSESLTEDVDEADLE